ncbi:MAG: winged helix-turn-helix transcriptional regulator [Solirubrobacteraceae bacterium]
MEAAPRMGTARPAPAIRSDRGRARSAFPDLSERVMWERLRELTGAGLISREVDPGPPIKSIYVATSRAADVRTSIEDLRGALGLPSDSARP